LGDGEAAWDAAQETFVRVWRHIDKTDQHSEPLGWIYRIATNYCLNELRNSKSRNRLLLQLPIEVSSPSLEAALADRAVVRAIIHRVPERLRTIAFLHYVDGMEQGEVAKLLDVSRRTVVGRLQEFHRRVRKILDEPS